MASLANKTSLVTGASRGMGLPMSRVNEAVERREAGKARYRILLDADV